jgi:hypothetical protein
MTSSQGKSSTNSKLVTRREAKALITGTINRLAERKINTNASGPFNVQTSGTVIPLTQPLVVGDGLDQRTGDKITLKGIRLSYIINLPSILVQGCTRVILFWDNYNNGTAVNVTDVLTLANVISGYEAVSLLKRRFHIISDRNYHLTAGGSQVLTDVIHYNKEHPVYYQGLTDASGSNSKGALFALAICDVTGATPMTIYIKWQLQFYDL